MVQLTNKQIDTVAQRIYDGGVANGKLFDSLLDHFCCYMEEEMTGGHDFDTAYAAAHAAISPNGTHEIQEELFFLLTFKKQTNMKRIIYGTGFISAFLISTSLLFRLLHWPWASMLTIAGFTMLLVAMAALFINSRKHTRSHARAYNVRVAFGFVAAILISVGSIFKALHFPGANIQVLLGMIILNLVFLPMFFFQLYKQAVATS